MEVQPLSKPLSSSHSLPRDGGAPSVPLKVHPLSNHHHLSTCTTVSIEECSQIETLCTTPLDLIPTSPSEEDQVCFITIDHQAYTAALNDSKIVATYDTGCTKSLQGVERIPDYCKADIFDDKDLTVFHTPSGELTTRRSVILPAQLTDNRSGKPLWVWIRTRVADDHNSPLLIAGATMGFHWDECSTVKPVGRVMGREVRMFVSRGVPRLKFRYPTEAEYKKLRWRRPELSVFKRREVVLDESLKKDQSSFALNGEDHLTFGSDEECDILDDPKLDPDNFEGIEVPCVPSAKTVQLIDQDEVMRRHRSLGHPGAVRLHNTLLINGLKTTRSVAQKVTSTCEACQRGKSFIKSPIKRQQKPDDPYADRFNHRVSIDLLFLTIIKASGVRYYVCTVTDMWSRYMQGYFLPSKDGGRILKVFRSRWIGRFSIPERLRLDNGVEFNLLVKWLEETGVVIERTAPYAATGNAICERQHGTFMNILRCVLHDGHLPPRIDILKILTEVYVPWVLNHTTNMMLPGGRTPAMQAGRHIDLTEVSSYYWPGQLIRYRPDYHLPKLADKCCKGKWLTHVTAGECVILDEDMKVIRIHPSKVKIWKENGEQVSPGRFSEHSPLITEGSDVPIQDESHPQGDMDSMDEIDQDWKQDEPPVETADVQPRELLFDEAPETFLPEIEESFQDIPEGSIHMPSTPSLLSDPPDFVPAPLPSGNGPRSCCHPLHDQRQWAGSYARPGSCVFGLCRFCCMLYQSQHSELEDGNHLRKCKLHKWSAGAATRYKDKLLHLMAHPERQEPQPLEEPEDSIASRVRDRGRRTQVDIPQHAALSLEDNCVEAVDPESSLHCDDMPPIDSEDDGCDIEVSLLDDSSDDDDDFCLSATAKSQESGSRSQGIKRYRKKTRHEIDPKSVAPDVLQKAKQKEIQGWADRNVYTSISEQEGISQIQKHKAVLIDSRWVVTQKEDKESLTGALKTKARAVLKGFQDARPNVSRNAPTAPPATVKVFWYVAQQFPNVAMGDIAQAFLSSKYKHHMDVLMRPLDGSQGFWKLNAAVYGLGDAPQRWYKEFAERATAKGWHRLTHDPCVFIRGNTPGKPQGQAITYLMLLFVDDILCAGQQPFQLVEKLDFPMGKLENAYGKTYVGITATQGKHHLCLVQKDYTDAIEVPQWNRQSLPPTPLPVPTPNVDESPLLDTPFMVTNYRGLVGKLAYLAEHTRPDLAFCAHYLSRFNSKPTKQSLLLAIRAVHYAKSTSHFGLCIPKPAKGDILLVFVDASLGALANDRKSQSGLIYGIYRPHTSEFFPIQWKSVMQGRIRRSSMSAELWAMELAGNMVGHMVTLLKEMGISLKVKVATDALDVVAALSNLTTPKDKMLIQPLELVRNYISDFNIDFLHIPRECNIADELTGSRRMEMLSQVLGTVHPFFPLPALAARKGDSACVALDLKEVSRPLAWDMFSGNKTATHVMEESFNVVTFDINSSFSPDVSGDILSLDYQAVFEQCLENGLGPVRFLWGTPPCNAWKVMRNQFGKNKVNERKLAASVIQRFLQIKQYCEMRLKELRPNCKFVCAMASPATGMLPAYMVDKGWLEEFGLTKFVTSDCWWDNSSHNHNHPTAIFSNLPLTLHPLCTVGDPCPRRKLQVDMSHLPRSQTSQLPPGLVKHIVRAALRSIQSPR